MTRGSADDQVIASCSFCMRPNTQVEVLVAGPGVYICDVCISSCAEVAQARKPLTQRLAPWERDLSDDDLLEILPRVAGARALADSALTEWVRKARKQNISWARIGDALGVTRQSAWERFSDDDPAA